jgi:aldose 1-epimerase
MSISRRELIAAVAACGIASGKGGSKKMTKRVFGKTAGGQTVDLYTLTNAHGAEVAIMNYGGTVVSLKVPDAKGVMADVILGPKNFEGYPKQTAFFGALIGRYGNRIGNGRFTLDGVTYKLPQNDGKNTLHGGPKGFDKAMWDIKEAGDSALDVSYLSKDGEEGFPGNLRVKVTYTWTDANELKIDYSAVTDKDTVVNLTNHSYFNLAGAGVGDILDHEVTIEASRMTPVDATLIPTGELRSVAGTPFDFRKPTAVGARINADDQQLKYAGGYDHNFVLDHPSATPTLAARVRDPKTGRVMEVLTTEPGVQFYTGNFLGGEYRHRGALCLETQHFPDSPNKPEFPSTELKPGQTYHTTTIYRFR